MIRNQEFKRLQTEVIITYFIITRTGFLKNAQVKLHVGAH
jgi:hypothetical protein